MDCGEVAASPMRSGGKGACKRLHIDVWLVGPCQSDVRHLLCGLTQSCTGAESHGTGACVVRLHCGNPAHIDH